MLYSLKIKAQMIALSCAVASLGLALYRYIGYSTTPPISLKLFIIVTMVQVILMIITVISLVSSLTH